jgi:hypothetical protein
MEITIEVFLVILTISIRKLALLNEDFLNFFLKKHNFQLADVFKIEKVFGLLKEFCKTYEKLLKNKVLSVQFLELISDDLTKRLGVSISVKIEQNSFLCTNKENSFLLNIDTEIILKENKDDFVLLLGGGNKFLDPGRAKLIKDLGLAQTGNFGKAEKDQKDETMVKPSTSVSADLSCSSSSSDDEEEDDTGIPKIIFDKKKELDKLGSESQIFEKAMTNSLEKIREMEDYITKINGDFFKRFGLKCPNICPEHCLGSIKRIQGRPKGSKNKKQKKN